MDKIFPKDFYYYSTEPGVKATLYIEIPPLKTGNCENCGGNGQMYLFCATGGPYPNSPGLGTIGKWHDNAWWTGETHGATCPVCNGFGRKKEENIYHVDSDKMERDFEGLHSVVKDD